MALSLSLYIYISIYISLYTYLYISPYLYISLSLYISISLYISLSIYLSFSEKPQRREGNKLTLPPPRSSLFFRFKCILAHSSRELAHSSSLCGTCPQGVHLHFSMASSIWYVHKIFRKTYISYPMISTRSCAYQEGKKCQFLGKFCVRTKWMIPIIIHHSFCRI